MTTFAAEALAASGRAAEKLSLPALQSKMKCDPEGYVTELGLLYSQFNSALELFRQQAAMNFTSITGVAADPTVSKDLGDRAMFLAHVTPFYPKQLADFPKQLADFLKSSAPSLPSGLRCHVTQALILLLNRQIVDIKETLALFVELQTLGDRVLRKLAFSHVIQSVRRMNKKHKNEAVNRALQSIVFSMLQQEDEAKAKRSLTILCELHRRKVWFDDRTANAICTACFHPSSRIMIAAISFLLDYEKIQGDEDSDDSGSDDDTAPETSQVAINKEAIYKAHHKGTSSSKKKKKAKLQRAVRSMKRQQRLSSEKNSSSNFYSPLNHLKDAQGFVEKLFSRLQTYNERFEVKMMMLKVIARTVGLHRLILLNFYPFLQKYIQPHQRDVTNLLAAAVQACHDMVPPDAVEPLFKQVVNQFVHDRSRPEAIAIGLNVIREICLRIPLLMTEDLLQDLVLYKKSHEKAVSVAARSLMILFRELCPSLLVKKDRGRPTDPKARPKAYGEVSVLSNVLGVELLEQNDDDDVDVDNDGEDGDDRDRSMFSGSDDDHDLDNEKMLTGSDDDEKESDADGEDEEEDSENSIDVSDADEDQEEEEEEVEEEEEEEVEEGEDKEAFSIGASGAKNSKSRKRNFSDIDINAAETSLRALKRLAEEKMKQPSSDTTDGILSNEDFQRIKELKAKNDAKIALSRQGLFRKGQDTKLADSKILSSDQLSAKRVDPAELEVHVRKKLSKEERLALVRAGREDRGKYQARAAVKQKKTGGLSNRQKEHKKAMPLAAKRSKVAKSRQVKNKKQQRSGKQFRGKKGWK
ncbi:protein SDA1 [Tripterygium wilfordii]|uniref:Protein SDA1 n=1 Tax=Tripterygium wilfordii TaxID=458696 RepID=A0A7J7DJP1_TRIWF|nr:protein SDA1 homolog [Tripterygium wilfordii]KAF5746528.1 protein SDA1 [Tripterygium wilfordii]